MQRALCRRIPGMYKESKEGNMSEVKGEGKKMILG